MAPERRGIQFGRREQDCASGGICSDHKWLVSAVANVNDTVNGHTKKLEKFLSRLNVTLLTLCLGLLGVILDVIIRWHIKGE